MQISRETEQRQGGQFRLTDLTARYNGLKNRRAEIILRIMKLPNSAGAVVSQEKITGYLLSFTHRDGRHKAAFFTRFGFAADSWETLAAALLRHAADYEVTKVEDSPFGTRYVVDGAVAAPDGRMPAIRSVWFIETGGQTPRFVTAYPLERRSK